MWGLTGLWIESYPPCYGIEYKPQRAAIKSKSKYDIAISANTQSGLDIGTQINQTTSNTNSRELPLI
jgi:hypothetical protein